MSSQRERERERVRERERERERERGRDVKKEKRFELRERERDANVASTYLPLSNNWYLPHLKSKQILMFAAQCEIFKME
jgi:hypothetical protein